jgi:enoyl-CoA hydratase/carnithine racemase
VSPEGLCVTRVAAVSAVRLDRPARRNAMTRRVLGALPDVLAEEVEAGARSVVLTGSDEVFSGGVDFAELSGSASDLELDELIGGVVSSIRRVPVPVVAAIEGPCVGAAVEVALACDLRIGGETAFFLLPAARLALVYRVDGVVAMCAEVGAQTTARLLVFGDRIPASEAVAAGLLAQVVPAGTAFAAARALAGAAAAAPPDVTRSTIELIRQAGDDDLDRQGWEALRRRLLESETRREAVAQAKRELGRGVG